jgi:hypothetical protein
MDKDTVSEISSVRYDVASDTLRVFYRSGPPSYLRAPVVLDGGRRIVHYDDSGVPARVDFRDASQGLNVSGAATRAQLRRALAGAGVMLRER